MTIITKPWPNMFNNIFMFSSVPIRHQTNFNGQTLTLETGLLAQQATSNVVISLGETTVMASVVIGKISPMDYFPLQVIYEERLYASGKIKGSRFIKREGRPSDNAILAGRMVDRSLRSLFDSHIRNEIQVILTILSVDEINPPDVLAVIAASSALKIATNNFLGPVSSVRIGMNRAPIGSIWSNQIDSELEKTTDFGGLTQFLTQVSETLDTKNLKDKEFLREIARKIANVSPDWAKDFAALYKQTPKLTTSQIYDKYPTEVQTLINPSYTAQDSSLVDLVVSGDGSNIMMVEAGASIIDEKTMGTCLDMAGIQLLELTNFQNQFLGMVQTAGKTKNVELKAILPDLQFEKYWTPFLSELELALYNESDTKEQKSEKINGFKAVHFQNLEAVNILNKKPEYANLEELRIYFVSHATNVTHPEISSITGETGLNLEICQNLITLLENGFKADEIKKELKNSLELVIKNMIQEKILEHQKRIDGRKLNQVRKLDIQIDVLPRVHASSLFQRGETQVLNILTLGTLRDAQTLDDMENFEETTKRYIHHYNFPSYSVGETGRYGAPGRREIGHGALAEKALLPVLPSEDEFPYTMRLVSECLGSNGSTSMASTCGSTLSLMAGGVPIKDMVAGIAMGLVLDSTTGNFKVLTDIQGEEDHNGDMDFKVTGTKDGITAIQLDNKVAGLTVNILKQALIEAKEGRLFILEAMKKVIAKPKAEISKYAPGVIIVDVPFDKIGELIGPAGKTIKGIIAKFNVEIDIQDDTGKTFIYSDIRENGEQAKAYIEAMVKEFAIGEIVDAVVYRIEAYGAFVKILAAGEETSKEGLIHISNLADRRINNVEEVVQMGQTVTAKIVEINEKGQIGLSLKELANKPSIN